MFTSETQIKRSFTLVMRQPHIEKTTSKFTNAYFVLNFHRY